MSTSPPQLLKDASAPSFLNGAQQCRSRCPRTRRGCARQQATKTASSGKVGLAEEAHEHAAGGAVCGLPRDDNCGKSTSYERLLARALKARDVTIVRWLDVPGRRASVSLLLLERECR